MRTIQADELKTPGLVLISRRQLLSIVPLSDRTIYNLEKRGDFPKRIALTSRNVAWDLGEVEAWIESRKTSGGQPARPGQTVIVS